MAVVGRQCPQPRVVDGPGEPAIEIGRTGPSGAQCGIACAQFADDSGLGAAPRLIGPRAGVDGAQPAARHVEQGAHRAFALQSAEKPAQPRMVSPCRQPAHQPFLLHQRREALVEGRIAGDVQLLVGQFMEEQPDHGVGRQGNHAAQERIAQVTQRRVGRGRADEHILACRSQPGGKGSRASRIEIAAIGRATGHREAPGAQIEGELRRGKHVPDRVLPPQVRVLPVAAVVGQGEPGMGKGERLLRQGEPGTQGGRCGCIRLHLGHGPACAQDGQLPGSRLHHVRGMAGRLQQRCSDNEHTPCPAVATHEATRISLECRHADLSRGRGRPRPAARPARR